MKRAIAFSFLIGGLFLVFSCKKSTDTQQTPLPTPDKVTVTINSTGPGTTAPTGTITYVSGASVSVTATPNALTTFSITDTFNGTSTTTTTSPYSFTATTAHTISVTYTPIDTMLTTHQLDSLNTQIQLKGGLVWHYAYAESKVNASVFNWQNLWDSAGYPCTKDDYLQFSGGTNLLWSINGTTCSFGWKVADENGTYKFINNGKSIAFTHDSKIDTLTINKFTQTGGVPDSLVVTTNDAYQTRTWIRYHCYPAKP